MKTQFPATIRDGGSSLILTVPREVQKRGFSSGDLVTVELEKVENTTTIEVKK